MGRLIDTDELMERLCFENTQEERDENLGEIITLDDIDNIPTAYDVDKVVNRLRELPSQLVCTDKVQQREFVDFANWIISHAIEIVKEGGK